MALQYLLAPTFQFVNTAGKPLSGGAYMEVYVHGTRTKYFCASDFDGTLHPFRIPLDSLGSNIVLANDTGSYDVYAYNRYGTLMMSRYNVKPGAGGGIGGTITSTDGSIDIHPTEDGVDLSVNGLDPSCLKVSADPRTTDGKFHFDTLVQEGDQAYVDNEGAIRLIKGWYHFTANVQLAWNAGARNETHQITLYTTLSNSVIDFDISHVHTETIELSGDVSIAQDGAELVIGVSGMPTGLEASVVSMDVHAITGKDGHDKYYAGNGITISNENYISADFNEVQEKLVAGQGVTIEGNVISAPSLVQVNSDWNATSGVAEILNKPDLDVFATKTEVNAGLAGKQNTIPDLAAIRSGAQAGASAVQPSDLAAVATTGDYNSLNNRPNLTVYATKTEVNAGLASKQDVISDLSAIRAGAQAGATAVQPAALDSYATKVELTAGLATKQDTINDLSEIRSGASAGSTALQPSDVAEVATTGDYDDLTNKPSIPTQTSDLTNDSGFITSADVPVKDVQVEGVSVVNAQGTAEIDLSGYATTQALTTGLASKQDIISDLATIRSGAAEGATAVQPGDLATVATTGSYDDLVDKPTIPAAQVNSDWNSNSGVSQILNKPTLAAVATTGDYDDLSNKPSIPAAQVNSDWNATSGVSEILNKPVLATVATTGSYNDLSNTPSIPTATSDLTNDSGYITLSDVPAQVQEVFIATYGTTTFSEITTAYNAGHAVFLKYNNSLVPLFGCHTEITHPYANFIGGSTGASVGSYQKTEWPIYQVNNSNVWSTSWAKALPYTNTAGKVLTSLSNGGVSFEDPAPGGVTDVEVDGTSVVSGGVASITMPTVDQTYNSASTDAQSGVAVAGALSTKQDTISDLATIRSGAADGATAVQPGDLAAVATTGAYSDLTGAPTIPTATSDLNNDSGFITLSDVPAQVNADWNSSSGASEILNKPTIPNATSDLTNDSGFITLSDVPAQVNADWNAVSGAAEILNKPTIPAAQVNSDWNASSGVAEILNKPTILPYKPVVAGTGVRIVDDTANNRIVVEADETVLWSGSNTSASLSESYTNFERIRVIYNTNDNAVYDTVFYSSQSGTSFTVDASNCNSTQTQYKMARFSLTSQSITFHSASTISFTDSGFASRSTTNPITLIKVVGINRVASN